jgi:2-hydroxychromene-2-carboxylate isomerase
LSAGPEYGDGRGGEEAGRRCILARHARRRDLFAPMASPAFRLHFDFVDPLSYLVHREARAREAEGGVRLQRVGVELRPRPTPLADAADPFWAARWEAAHRAAPRVPFALPGLVPWSGKAHELHALACERGVGPVVLEAIFEAYLLRGRDIGRIDVLLEIASDAGLDRTATKAALDVDAWEGHVGQARRTAESLGVVDLPAISWEGRLVQGFHNLTDLGTLLGGSP